MHPNSAITPTLISLRDRFDISFNEIHEAVRPADVREFDRIEARVRLRSSPASEFESVKVWRLSPLGIELVCTPDRGVLRKSERIDLELSIGGQLSHFEGLVVDVVKENDNISLAGVRFSTPSATLEEANDKRRSQRWLCSEEFYPTCVAPTPGRFNEYVYFQIRDVSREGFQLVCSLRNKYLVPGMKLNLTASFPMAGDVSVPVTLSRIGLRSEREKDYLVVGAEFQELSKSAKSIIGQYLLQFSNVETLAELKDAGFIPASVARSTDFYFLKTEAEYEEVLKLRRLAHRAGGTLDEDTDFQEMSDQYDSKSRIIVAKHKGQIIGSARIHYCDPDDLLEHEQYIAWPSAYPRRDSILEITRVCTHPSFRSNDLLASMLIFLGMTCFQAQRPWVLVSSTDALLPFYSKIGLQRSGLSYQHPVYRGNQNILLTNAFDILVGRGVNPLYWNAIWKPVFDFQFESGAIRPTALDKARVRIYRILSPVASLLTNLARRPRKR